MVSGGKVSSKFKVGARRYNGVSMAPQVGKGGVNKAGYNQRDTEARLKRQMLQDQLRKKGK